jgi:hypothetical protein
MLTLASVAVLATAMVTIFGAAKGAFDAANSFVVLVKNLKNFNK